MSELAVQTLRMPGGYQTRVCVGRNALAALSDIWQPQWRDSALIADENVMQLYGDQVEEALGAHASRVIRLAFAAGEPHKVRQTKEQLEDALLSLSVDRQLCIVALGGGISLDLAGFVAATLLRGVTHINIPTTLLAMVDASVGGKTGLNTEHGKNLIGALHHPHTVFVDPAFLTTLAAVEWKNGLAELVKHAVIADAELFEQLFASAEMLREPTALAPELLQRGVDIKSQIVVRDPTEQNERAVLNFGHTVGHALEKASGHQIPHGLAVARGMVIEGFLATRLCGFEPSELDRLIALLTALEIPLLDDIDPQAARAFLKSDKKRAAGQLRVALPRRIGQMAVEKLPESQTDEGLAEPRFTLAVEEEDVMQAWQAAKDRLAAAR